LFAQSLIEYGVLASIKSQAHMLTVSIRDWLRDAGPLTWLALGAAAVVVVWFWRRPTRY
jgi:hypothetical protein